VSGGNRRPADSRRTLVFYVSGHAFGHASRAIEIINAVQAADAGLEVVVRTAAARWLFDVSVRRAVEFHDVRCDTGVVQSDSLHLDEPRSIEQAARFMADIDALAAAEAAFLRERGATMVVGDIPPLAFLAAHEAGLPSVAIGNFTWDWIYAGYPEALASAPGLVPAIRRAYRLASRTLRLPMWGGFEEWGSPIIDIPFVGRHSTRSPDDVRRQLGVSRDSRMVLLSFGGLGISGLALEPLSRLDGYAVVTTTHAFDAVGPVPPGVRVLEDRAVYARGLRYEDLVRAADIVVTKPGYGIITECLANDAAMLYTDRGRFAEYEVLVREMPKYLRCRFLPREDLFSGRWGPHLEALLAQPAALERPRTDGASVAASLLLSRL
jgi:hypothetical protein